MVRFRSAVLFMEETVLADSHRPLMLEEFLAVPILTRMSRQLLAEGIQRFFLACDEAFAAQARECFPPDAEVVISNRHEALMDFLNTPDPVLVLNRSAIPAASAGPGFAYAAPGHTLQETWRERMSNAVQDAELVAGWIPVYGPETLAELEEAFAAHPQETSGPSAADM